MGQETAAKGTRGKLRKLQQRLRKGSCGEDPETNRVAPARSNLLKQEGPETPREFEAVPSLKMEGRFLDFNLNVQVID